MALEIYPKEQVFRSDPTARIVLEHLVEQQRSLHLSEAVVFCEFPLFKEDNEILSAKIVVASPEHGVLLIATEQPASGTYEQTAKALEGTFSQVFSRLVKYPRLRKDRTTLATNLDAFLFLADAPRQDADTNDLVVGLPALRARLQQLRSADRLPAEGFSELISVLDGSKALLRAPERNVTPFGSSSKIAQISALEDEIRRFDRDQRIAYMTEVFGTQRVRGLAGSGKTVVLAMKAALTAIRNSDARIAFTFHTKSLYQHVKQLITRFYRLYDDRDPDWTRLRVLHSWGGGMAEGLYSNACKAFGETPLTLSQAKQFDPLHPFEFACGRLLENSRISSLFDYVFVDEGQDFGPSFLRLALRLAAEERLVVAYDVLQTIYDVDIPTAESMFGTKDSGEPAVSFEEDVILHRCYRNPREVLVSAHATGFGLYSDGKIAQMLESKEHWEDFGYKILSGELESGQQVVIERPEENSPSTISRHNRPHDLIRFSVFATFSDEVTQIAREIAVDIKEQGVPPDDILVISADDRHARMYFRSLTQALKQMKIDTNNLQDDSYVLRDFQMKGQVTLSTIYKAKGNEAYVVYVVGLDALFFKPNIKARNMIFTAMTRAKGWLRMSGVGPQALSLQGEVNKALAKVPNLEFVYPGPEELTVMKRDLSMASSVEIDEALNRLEQDLSEEDLEQALVRKLRELRSKRDAKFSPRRGKGRKP